MRLWCIGAAMLALGAVSLPVSAGQQAFAVPKMTIYPGDAISGEMIDERPGSDRTTGTGYATRSQVVGKLARRTLLPGQAIPLVAVRDPDVVRSGKAVTMVFAVGGLVITARGMSMQAGAIGDSVSVQSADSGTVVRGTVQADGTVRIEE